MYKNPNLLSSFRHAINGIKLAVKHERNMAMHFCIALVVMAMAYFWGLTANEYIALLLCCGLVIMAEMFNTAIEKTLDFMTQAKCYEIKFIKDVSAAGVIIASAVALLVGLIIFIPRAVDLFF